MKGDTKVILQIYGVYDEKAKSYLDPFYFGHDGEALRKFSDVIQNDQSPIAKHPGDYSMYKLGKFDSNSGHITADQNPQFLAKALDFVKST